MRVPDAATAARGHVLENTVSTHVHVHIRVLGLDLVPVAFQLFGHQLGQTGERTLTQLRARDTDNDRVVGLNHDPVRHFRRATGFSGDGSSRGTSLQAQDKGAAQGSGLLEEGAAGGMLGYGGHGLGS